MNGTITWFVTLIPALFGLTLGVFMLTLFYRLVIAVEKIAERES